MTDEEQSIEDARRELHECLDYERAHAESTAEFRRVMQEVFN